MKFLVRNAEPVCLVVMKRKYSGWGDVTFSDKQEIWLSLDEMQNNYCAFCEMTLKGMRKHIEHFISRCRKNVLTFEWTNLFGSCDNSEHCGRYKDIIISDYDENNLIKPDENDPRNFLSFSPEGDISVKLGLSEENELKATETIRVFGLDAPDLVAARRTILSGYNQIAKEYVELVDLAISEGGENIKVLVDEIYAEYSITILDQPFSTALSQLLDLKFTQ